MILSFYFFYCSIGLSLWHTVPLKRKIYCDSFVYFFSYFLYIYISIYVLVFYWKSRRESISNFNFLLNKISIFLRKFWMGSQQGFNSQKNGQRLGITEPISLGGPSDYDVIKTNDLEKVFFFLVLHSLYISFVGKLLICNYSIFVFFCPVFEWCWTIWESWRGHW